MDLLDSASVTAAVDEAKSLFEGVDILINNAGEMILLIMTFSKSLWVLV